MFGLYQKPLSVIPLSLITVVGYKAQFAQHMCMSSFIIIFILALLPPRISTEYPESSLNRHVLRYLTEPSEDFLASFPASLPEAKTTRAAPFSPDAHTRVSWRPCPWQSFRASPPAANRAHTRPRWFLCPPSKRLPGLRCRQDLR